MAALFDVHLKQVAHVVKRGACVAQEPLLLNRRRLGIALRDDDAAPGVAKLARHFLINRLAVVVAEAYFGIRLSRLEKDAPTIVGHFHVIEIGPALRFDTDRRAQPHVGGLEAVGAHLAPPIQIVGQPLLQRPLQFLVFRKIYVVRYAIVKVHGISYWDRGRPARKACAARSSPLLSSSNRLHTLVALRAHAGGTPAVPVTKSS